MAQTSLGGTPVTLAGDVPAIGAQAPEFTLVNADLEEVTLADVAGKRVVLNIYPSIDTGVCAQSVRTFNELATKLDNTVVLGVSHDLPFALNRFCGAEGIENMQTLSAFRSSFGDDYGVTLQDSPMAGLLARAIVVLGTDGEVTYTQVVPEIRSEPDYDAVLAHLRS